MVGGPPLTSEMIPDPQSVSAPSGGEGSGVILIGGSTLISEMIPDPLDVPEIIGNGMVLYADYPTAAGPGFWNLGSFVDFFRVDEVALK